MIMHVKLKHLLLIGILCSSANLIAQEEQVSHSAEGQSGNTPTTPVAHQTFAQPPETGMEVTRFNNIRTVHSSDNWSVSGVTTALTAGVQATVTIPIGPVGVDTGGTARFGGPWGQYQIRIV